MPYNNDTIAAISTPYGESGIGIVRISGIKSEEIFKKLFRPKSDIQKIKSHTMYYGKIFDSKGEEQIDEILAVLMKGPRTYTREDCVEFHCHGGPFVLKKVLDSVLEAGARLAEPGEFTKRAFLNGRIDLSQAEAVIDVIHAKTEKSLKYAQRQLNGKLSEVINNLKDDIVDILSEIEAFIDFNEDGIESPSYDDLLLRLDSIIINVEKIISTFNQGRLFKEGANVIIIGKTNVGKSSLFNRLLNEERAIVTEIPGTTRDIIEDEIDISGIPIKLIDTAGIRESNDIIENIGQKMREKRLLSADLVLFVIDISQPFNECDLDILKRINSHNRILVLNKIDIQPYLSRELIQKFTGDEKVFEVSALYGTGIEELKRGISEKILKNSLEDSSEAILTNIRHKHTLEEALLMLLKAKSGIKKYIYPELIAFDLRKALFSIGKISGETATEDILDKIFKEFCIGK